MRWAPSNDGLTFYFSAQEKDLFLAVLDFYPLLNPDYHRLSKTVEGKKMAEEQQLLRDAMDEQRRTNKKKLGKFVEGLEWNSTAEQSEYQVALSPEQIDWLLLVLNDVRVGAWDIVGRPDHSQRAKMDLQSKNSHYYGVMELSGLFQSAFLAALERKNGPA